MVGNMMDMKKSFRNAQATDSQPNLQKTRKVAATFSTASRPSILWAENISEQARTGETFPTRKQTKPSDARLEAPLSLMERMPD